MPRAIRSIDHYSGIGFPRGYNRLHSHTYDEISLLNQGDITYISDSIIDKVTGRSLIYSKAYQLHNPYVAPDKMYERSQICTEPAAAAELTGYLSTWHFINVFVSHNNITPLKYRQMRKEKNF